MPEPLCDGTPPPPTCPAGTYTIWTCDGAHAQRERCIAGVDEVDVCRWGACISMPVGVDDLCPAPPDADGDGATADVDCNDGDATVHPGATDTCGDGIDQDCVGGDASCTTLDGGAGSDAGAALDASVALDAGVAPDAAAAFDAGTPPHDAGRSDGGATAIRGGCGCSLIGRSESSPLFLVILGLGTLRRSSRAPRR
jgi:hypothetical protein